jgi:uncharacterized protein with FMN-binding domain
MSKEQPARQSRFMRTVRKWFVSGFVVCTFAAYAVHERLSNPNGGVGTLAPAQSPAAQQAIASPQPSLTAPPAPSPSLPPAPTATAAPSVGPTEPATAAPAPAAPQVALGAFKDGAYTGAEVDAYYGLVQVKAVVQGGKITDVEFLEYPNDRRTSIRINRVAIPYLTQEAIQAQSAEVDIISGATLTSEAFAQSLQSALETAKA